MNIVMQNERVLSGMRPTGKLHLGHYHGALKNWLELQHKYECFFCIVDIHALTTHYEDPSQISQHVIEMAIDWLAVGIDPDSAHIFVQSHVPEHAELHLLLSMITPLSWLERVPTYKEQQEKIQDKDLATYGFLGYPLLQSADILLYKAGFVPVGEDQVPHIELTREVARRFNFLYGREVGFEDKAEVSIRKMGKKNAKLYRELLKAYQEQGDKDALETARSLLEGQQNISLGDRERLFGYLEGGGKIILPEPQVLLTKDSKLSGVDGQKMSKSYHNSVFLREEADDIDEKIRKMTTDPARVRRTDPGNPTHCPVWGLHKVYSDDTTKKWVDEGCRHAGIGCLDCKKPLIEAIEVQLKPIREKASEYQSDLSMVKNILAEGADEARNVARETLEDVKEAMGIAHV